MIAQLSLALSLRDEATFDNFFAPDGDPRAVVKRVLSTAPAGQEHLIFLWGGAGSGLSHLLQATCHSFITRKLAVQYLAVAEVMEVDPAALLAGMENQALVCIDGIDAVAGKDHWERALFNLFNKIREKGHLMVVGANCSPRELGLHLPDLQSRLSWGLTFHLAPYNDLEKQAILRFRAGRLGIEMPEEVAAFILNRCGRDLDELMARLRKLDSAALQAKRRVTIPFVKEVFSW